MPQGTHKGRPYVAARCEHMYDPEKHHRRSIRLRHYDYSQPGLYYVTIVVNDRRCLFGDVVDAQMVESEAGKMIREVWNQLPCRFLSVALDRFIVMPNHMHGIIRLVVGARCDGPDDGGAATRGAATRAAPTLGDVVGAFKSLATHAYTIGVKQRGWQRFNGTLWQRNYYEHVVRDEFEWAGIQNYIRDNPLNWTLDCENPDARATDEEEPWRY